MRDPSDNTLIVLGATARAATQSARRAGFSVWGADLFADADLLAVADARAIERYPAGFLAALRKAPESPWIYTGGLENYPALLRRLSQIRPCWGNQSEVARRVRDPLLLASLLPAWGIEFPPTFALDAERSADEYSIDGHATRAAQPPEPSSRWLLKPHRSAGGTRIDWADEQRVKPRHGRWYAQRYLPGQPCSAVFLAAAGRAILIGVSRQFIGANWLHASGFAYCGSIGPLPLDAQQQAELQRMGDLLAAEFELQGLFGVDLIDRAPNSTDSPSPRYAVVEINPRYTASVEVLERALGFKAIAWHVAACRDRRLPANDDLCFPTNSKDSPPGVLAKGILFARAAVMFSTRLQTFLAAENREVLEPIIADLPAFGTVIPPGAPIVSLFAWGEAPSDAEERLRRLVARFECLLYADSQSPVA